MPDQNYSPLAGSPPQGPDATPTGYLRQTLASGQPSAAQSGQSGQSGAASPALPPPPGQPPAQPGAQGGQTPSGASAALPPQFYKALSTTVQGKLGMSALEDAKSQITQAKPFLGVLEDPKASEADQQNAYAQLSKLFGKSKQAKETLTKAQQVQGVMRKLGTFVRGLTPEGAAEQGREREEAQAAGTREREAATAHQYRMEEAGAGLATKEQLQAQKDQAAMSRLQATGATRLQAIDETAKLRGDKPLPGLVYREGADGSHQMFRQILHQDGSVTEEDAGTPKPTSTRPVQGSQVMTLDSAKAQLGQGMALAGPGGQPWTQEALDSLPPEMMLQPWSMPGGNLTYVPFDPKSQMYTVGNRRYAATAWQLPHLVEGEGVELGAAQVPSTTQRTVPGVDPATGQPVTNVLPSQRVPESPGVPGRAPALSPPQTSPQVPPQPAGAVPAGGQPTAARPTAPGGGQTQRPAPGGAPSPTRTPAPSGVHGPVSGAPLPGMSPGQYNQALSRVTAVREASSQVFGDPTQPDFPSLSKFGALADNAGSKSRLGTAITLALDELDQQEKAGGSLTTLAKNWTGIPQALSKSKTAVFQDVMSRMTPEERRAYNATMSAFSTIVGLRSLTKASEAQFSVKAIEREMPVIGVNTYNSAQFRTAAHTWPRWSTTGLRASRRLCGVPARSSKSNRCQEKLGKAAPSGSAPASDKPWENYRSTGGGR